MTNIASAWPFTNDSKTIRNIQYFVQEASRKVLHELLTSACVWIRNVLNDILTFQIFQVQRKCSWSDTQQLRAKSNTCVFRGLNFNVEFPFQMDYAKSIKSNITQTWSNMASNWTLKNKDEIYVISAEVLCLRACRCHGPATRSTNTLGTTKLALRN